jgi:hypothetical protein
MYIQNVHGTSTRFMVFFPDFRVDETVVDSQQAEGQQVEEDQVHPADVDLRRHVHIRTYFIIFYDFIAAKGSPLSCILNKLLLSFSNF